MSKQQKPPKQGKKAEPQRKREVCATPPAQGERNAKGGFQPQDKFRAALVVEGLKEGTLRGIRIAAPLRLRFLGCAPSKQRLCVILCGRRHR